MKLSCRNLLSVLLLMMGLSVINTSADQPVRENGTMPEDWEFDLPDGVTTRDVTFYSDEVPCYGRVFFPKGFSTSGKTPAVVLGHGFGGMHHGIDKFAAYFASRGLVAMTIDYRFWGWSEGLVTLLDPDVDTATDDTRVSKIEDARIEIRRTRLISVYQVEDYRAAISYLQGEPGVDLDNIGAWGSSHSGGHMVVLPALDARVKATVGQVAAVGGGNGRPKTPPAFRERTLNEAIRQARTNEASESLRGFSWRRMHESYPFNSNYRPFHYIERVPDTTAVLFIVAENEELFSNETSAFAAAKALRGPSEVIEVPEISHFQMYSGDAYKVSSKAAADWFLKHLR
ncbi:MAG: hypothetical protein VCC01_08135 [Candidatus Hydrogenedentota bacterium]